MAGGGPGGMGQAICPGDSAALMPLPVLILLTLPRVTRALAAATIRGSGGAWIGREVRTVPGDSMVDGDIGETGDGVKPVVATESYVKTDTRLLSRAAPSSRRRSRTAAT